MTTLVILFLLFSSTTQGAEWFEETISEDEKNFYYVGVSSKKPTEKEALEDAYADALKEAVRHNFGVMHDYVGQYAQSQDDLQIRQNTLLYRSGVKVVGAIPLDKLLIEDDDKYIAYRKIKYPKSEIVLEKERLKHRKEKDYSLKPIEMHVKEKFEPMPADIPSNEYAKDTYKPYKKKDHGLAKFSWVWMPISATEQKSEFITLPIKLEVFPAKYLSFGFTYILDADDYEEDYDRSVADKKNDKQSSYYSSSKEGHSEDTTDLSFDIKLYPIRTKWLSVGIGAEYNYNQTTIYSGTSKNQSDIEKESKSEEIGRNATLRITLVPVEEDVTGKSLYMDFREFKEHKIYSLGISFDY